MATTPKPTAPTPSPDLASASADLGISFSAGGNPYNDPTDLPVWTFNHAPTAATVLSSKLKSSFYALEPAELRDLQKRLWAGGFYKGVDPDKVILGVHDDYTAAAYEGLIDRSAQFYQAGRKFTPDDVLDQAAGVYDQVNAAKGRRAGLGPDGGAGDTTRAPLTVDLTSPEDLRAIAQRAAVSALGRALRDDELNRFVTSFQGRERQAQTQGYNISDPNGAGGTAVSPPDPSVAAQQFAQGVAPVESGAHAFVKTYRAFSSILSKGAQ
jgi:hypothetical protein